MTESPQTTKVGSHPTVDAKTDFPTVGSADVAIFWDFENVRIPAWCPATTAAEGIRNKVVKYGRIVEKRLYFDSRRLTETETPRSELDLSGFTLVDCPSRNRKETLDKKLIVDVLCFAWERASLGAKACVVLITSDGDYSYALARLRDIGVFTIVIYRPDIVAKVLIDNANVVISWEHDVLGGPPLNDDGADGHDLSQGRDKATTLVDESIDCKSGELEVLVKQPDVQTRGKFALFCSVVLNAQQRNVQEGISLYSSWASEAGAASTFYEKVGEKDRKVYIDIRTLAFQKRFIEWGRRNLAAPGKPVIKVKDRDERTEKLSLETYLRLTYSGLSVLKPNMAAKASDWTMVLPKVKSKLLSKTESRDETFSMSSSSVQDAKASKGSLFVGGLAWQTTEDSLRSYFRQFGPLKSVVVIPGRGFGFVRFCDSCNAETVLESNDHKVDEKLVDVKPNNMNK